MEKKLSFHVANSFTAIWLNNGQEMKIVGGQSDVLVEFRSEGVKVACTSERQNVYELNF